MIILLLVSALALGLILLITTAREAPSGYWAPAGYIDQANELIQSGGLTLACPNLDAVERDSILIRFAPGSDDDAFFNTSYLRADVRQFNSDPRAAVSPFRTEGCQLLGVNPFFHRIDLPRSPLVTWRGDVRYTTHGRTASLIGLDGQSLDIRHPGSRFDRRQSASVPVGFPRDTSAHVLLLTAPGATGYLADITFIGADPVLSDRRRSAAEPGIRVNGFEAFQGRMIRLEEGDWLRFETGDRPPTFVVDRETRRGTASLVRVLGEEVERIYLVDRDRPFVAPLARAMDEALRAAADQGRSPEALSSMNIRLSVDLPLSERLDGRLQALCREQPDQVPDRPRSVALIVLDAFTGEVRAMPTCPNEPWLDERYPNVSDRVRERALRNQNLVPNPIGSAGKPFWAAAIASKFPNFLDLQIPPSLKPEVEGVLGCELRASFENSYPTGAWVGLESFIEHSCNRYLVELASAALMIDGDVATAGGCTEARTPAEMRACLPRPRPGQPSGQLRFCDVEPIMEVAFSTEVRGVGSSCHELKEVERGFLPLTTFEAITNALTVREPSPPRVGSPMYCGIGIGPRDTASTRGEMSSSIWKIAV